MKSSKDIRRAVLAELGRLGIRAQVVDGGKHPMVVWEHNGQMRAQTLPSTPSCHRAKQNCVSDVRRVLRRDGVI